MCISISFFRGFAILSSRIVCHPIPIASGTLIKKGNDVNSIRVMENKQRHTKSRAKLADLWGLIMISNGSDNFKQLVGWGFCKAHEP